jgi:hypothetical protein
MGLRQRLKDPRVTLRLGCISLILANAAKWFLHPNARWQDPVDLGVGLLFGMAIGLLLLSLRSRRRGCAPAA